MMATTTQVATVVSHPFFDFNDAADLILPRHDKDEIRARLLDQLESVLLYLFPRGKRCGSQFYIGNLQGEPGDSLVVELEGPKRGVWIDFATGESGDVLALWASTRGYHLPADFIELLEDAGDWLMVPRITAAPVLHTRRAYDELGPHTGKWQPAGLCLSPRHTQRQAVPPLGCAGARHADAGTASALQPACDCCRRCRGAGRR